MLPLFAVTAQPNLNLKRVVNNLPTIELYYTVACSGSPVWNLSSGDFRLYDAGKEVTQLTMYCPDPTVPCAMSTALVFDASGSMAGAGNAGAIQAGKTFVGTMDGVSDEAAVIWFNQNVTVQQGMTSDTAQLSAAIGMLPAGGLTAVWDGIMVGLQEVQASCSLRIPGLRKDLSCGIDLIDSLQLDPSGHNVVPNPVSVRYRVRNTGEQEIRLRHVMLSFPADGLSLSASSPLPMSTGIDVLLKSGDSTEFAWLMDVRNRGYDRTALFIPTLIDADGDPHICDARLFIPGIQGAIDCVLSSDTVRADVTNQVYIPMPFAVNLSAMSNKAALSDSVWARIILPPGGLVLAGPDAGRFTKTLSPSLLFPQQQGQAQWMLEHPLTTINMRYTVRTLLWEKGGDTTFCETEVLIPAMPAPFWFTLGATGPLAFCEGGQVTLDAGAGYASYFWSTGDTTQSIIVTQSGTYWCGVTASDGLPGLSNTVTVTVYPLPAKPAITRTGDVLSTDPAAAWQWYRNGAVIAGANARTLTADTIGNYQVRIIDANGCEALSDAYAVNVLDVDEGQTVGQRFTLYPNPADGMLNVDVTLERPAPSLLIVRDLLGRELLRRTHSAGPLSFTETLDLRDLESGVYLVQLEAGAGVLSRLVLVR